MATIASLRTHLIDELSDLLDAENQLTDALPRLAQAATSKPLRTAEEWQSQDEETMLSRAAKWAGSTAGYASGQLTTRLRAAASTVGFAHRQSPGKSQNGGRTRQTRGRGRGAVGKKR